MIVHSHELVGSHPADKLLVSHVMPSINQKRQVMQIKAWTGPLRHVWFEKSLATSVLKYMAPFTFFRSFDHSSFLQFFFVNR
jgi:hypothetical protein